MGMGELSARNLLAWGIMKPLLAATLALSAFPLTLTPAFAQCEGEVLDTLDGLSGLAVDQRVGSHRVVTAKRDDNLQPPRLDVFERPAQGEPFAWTGSIQPPLWEAGWSIRSLVLEGDVIAHQFDPYDRWPPVVSISERTSQGWTTSEVELPGNGFLLGGQRTAISGERIAALSGFQLNSPLRIQFIERAAGTGDWEIVDRVVLQGVIVPWIDYPLYLDMDGDVAVVCSDNSESAGSVAVCERDASGGWSQTVLLRPPTDLSVEFSNWWVESLAVRGDDLAVVRRSSDPLLPPVLHIYRRSAFGVWDIVDRRSIQALFGVASTLYSGPVAFDADQRLAISAGSPSGSPSGSSSGSETLVFSRDSSGRLVSPHRVTGIGGVVGFSSGSLIGARYRARAVDVPVGPGSTEVCPLVGLTTCAGTGAPMLRVHDFSVWPDVRRATAEVRGAPPGATILLLRSNEPGLSTVLGGQLCIDRLTAVRAGGLTQVSSAGTALFQLETQGINLFGNQGFGASDHLQAVVLGSTPGLTNSVAWIP